MRTVALLEFKRVRAEIHRRGADATADLRSIFEMIGQTRVRKSSAIDGLHEALERGEAHFRQLPGKLSLRQRKAARSTPGQITFGRRALMNVFPEPFGRSRCARRLQHEISSKIGRTEKRGLRGEEGFSVSADRHFETGWSVRIS